MKCYIDGEPSKHEGYVINSKNPYKIVDRLTFSRANFNLRKNWKNEKFSAFLKRLPKSFAAQEAEKLNLKHVGYGNADQTGKVTYESRW